MEPDPNEVAWLLQDLCTQLGYSTAVRQQERFIELVSKGPDSFADAVLLAEGVDPTVEKRLRWDVRQFVAARFQRWSPAAPKMDYYDPASPERSVVEPGAPVVGVLAEACVVLVMFGLGGAGLLFGLRP